MSGWSQISFSFLTVALLAACTQPPAPVEMLGDRSYGRGDSYLASNTNTNLYSGPRDSIDSGSKYQSSSPSYSAPASVSTVGSRELAPLQPVSSQPLPPPAQPAASSVSSPMTMPAPAPLPQPAATVSTTPVSSITTPPVATAPVASVASSNTNAPLHNKVSIDWMAKPQAAPAPTQAAAPVAQASAPVAPPTQTAAPKSYARFIWPVQGRVISKFGSKDNGVTDDGIRIEAEEGEPIWASADGVVVYAGDQLKGYGNMVVLRHDGGWVTTYAHASQLTVRRGDAVRQGQLLGYVGSSGSVSSAQLHFGIREGAAPVDPERVLSRDVAALQ